MLSQKCIYNYPSNILASLFLIHCEYQDLYIPSNTPLVTTSGRLLVESAWTYGSQWKVKTGWCPRVFGLCIEQFVALYILEKSDMQKLIVKSYY